MDKKILKIFQPPKIQWVGDGFRVYHYIPTYELSMQKMAPFIMLDYHTDYEYLPNSSSPRGVGAHPHKGFETVTIVYQGALEHQDSAGNGGVIFAGDVQWMTAGSGILHKELHEKNFSKKGGILQLVQLWVNLPQKYKLVNPHYQAIENQKIPKYYFDNNKSYVEVIAGQFKNYKGIAKTYSPIHLFNFYLENQSFIDFKLEEGFTTCLLVIQGEIELQNELIHKDELVLLSEQGEQISVLAKEKSIVLLMSGKPLNEPIAAYGPFVMNTQKEIYQAIEEYEKGKFGKLE